MKFCHKSQAQNIKRIGIFTAFAAGSLTTFADKPLKNILFLMADDFNYWTAAQGYYPLAKTPNLDKFANKGIMFTDAHCSSPVSNPSRNALWSGFRPVTSGIQGNQDGYIREKTGFANIKTMNQYFKENGYWVYGAGKLYHPGNMSDGDDKDQANWSQRYTDGTGCFGGTYLSWQNPEWNEMSYSVNGNAMTESNCGDFKMVKAVAQYITNYPSSANKDKPFFIGCGVFRPHLPWNMPKEFWDKFNTDTLEIPKGYKTGDLSDVNQNPESSHTAIIAAGKWKESIHAYLASLALADYNIGILLSAIENSPLKENTIICFMGDHGWHLGEKEKWGKNTLFDAANRTTLIIYDPSAKGNGQRCHKVVSLQDLYPTLVELSGLPIKTDIEGNSLAPLLEEPNRYDWDKPIMMSYAGTDYIKTNKWRYVRDTNTSRRMLYDIVNDPYEFTNVYKNSQYSTIIASLTTQLDSMIDIGLSLKNKLLSKYNFTPVRKSIPGTIEAEDYDEGGYKQTYYDADKINTGGMYRTADGTDIYITDDVSGSYHLAGLSAGEWCMYTVQDYLSGYYNIDLRLKNAETNPAVIQIFNRETLLAEVNIQGSTPDWQTVRVPRIALTEQASTRLQIKIKSGSGIQLNWLKFEMTNTANPEITANYSRKCLENSIVSDNIMYLNLQNTDPVTNLAIYDLNGKAVSQQFVSGEQNLAYQLPVKLSQGIYFLRVSDDQVSSVEKFIVK